LPAVLNAANEIAVAKFLDHQLDFIQIPQLVEETLQAHQSKTPKDLEDILEADRWARERALQLAAA